MSNPHRVRFRAKRRKRANRHRNSRAMIFLRAVWRWVNEGTEMGEYRGFTWIQSDRITDEELSS